MDELAMYYFHQGVSTKAYELLGSFYTKEKTTFRVYAPNAKYVSVIGEFNNWDLRTNPMKRISDEGIYEVVVDNVPEFSSYQYAITTKRNKVLYKSDPYAYHFELRPNKNSKVFDLNKYKFKDDAWMNKRRKTDFFCSPINIYELHFGSWKKYDDGNFINYYDLASEIVDYVSEMGYTHIELLPLTEYPYDPSWGYQVTGYFASTSRYGTPDGLMYFIDYCHNHNIGVILDWVPAHFAKDEYGLIEFDGTYLYEPSNVFMREHPSWGTRCFDYSKKEVVSFLVSSAMFFIEKYHIDGLRVDAVSSMLYLDFDRKEGQYVLNKYGNNINLDALEFIKRVNNSVKSYDSSVMMIAEESSAYPNITRSVDEGGLGFDFKWNMGWMNDTLRFIEIDPYFRGDNIGLISFQGTYFFSEYYILALSHDEVVHLKKSIIEKIPGAYDQKFAGVKSYMTYMMTHPGKKLNFMGYEIGQFREWSEQRKLDWSVLDYERHNTLSKYIKDLNNIYKKSKSLYNDTTYWDGFKWLVVDDRYHSVFSYLRKCDDEELLVIINFAYCEWNNYGIDIKGTYKVILCSEDIKYSGSKKLQNKVYNSTDKLIIDLPYNSGIILRKVEK